MKPTLSIVIPMHNEADSIDPLFERLLPIVEGTGQSWEIICVNDGSTDATVAGVLKQSMRRPAVRLIDLSRRFGKEAALTAGLDYAMGKAVIILDADLQDPPELIPEMISKWRDGAEMVYAVRRSRGDDGFFKRACAALFYFLFNLLVDTRIPPDAGDYRLMDRQVVDALKRMPERARFMKGIYAWLGFRQASVPFDRPSRHGGRSQWSYFRLFRFALDGLFSFSTIPLRVSTWVGLATASAAFLYTIYFLVRTLIYGPDVPGYPSLIIAIMFFGGAQLFSIGILGEYVGRVFAEAKGRPLYVVREIHGFGDAPFEPADPGKLDFDDSTPTH